MKRHEKLTALRQGVQFLSDETLTEIIGRDYLAAAVELVKRMEVRQRNGQKISSSADAHEVLKPYYIGTQVEEFNVIYLRRNSTVISTRNVSKGGLTGTVADVRVILKQAIELQACAMILSHNHPSGERRPSPADIDLTKKVKEAALLMDIEVLDHLIICADSYYSFADEGMI
jgi:DNA repair protein RadC